MRSHGVSTFPDPDRNGVWPKTQVAAAAGSPRYPAAARVCGHLLPDGGPGVPLSPTAVRQLRTDMLRFTRCMRSHGVRNWPDPSPTPNTPRTQSREIFNPQAVGIDPDSDQISAKMQECERVFPPSLGLPPGA
jgi:hypothetical protein